MAAGGRPRRAGEELVPRAEAGALALDEDGALGVHRAGAAVGERVHEGGDGVGDRGERLGVPVEQRRRDRAQALTGAGGRTVGGLGHQGGADLQVDGDVLPGVDLGKGAHEPRAEGVDPGLDGEAVEAEALDGEAGRPVVVAECLEGDGRPATPRRAVQEAGRDGVLAVGEDVGGHHHVLAAHALHREAAGVDDRGHVLDDHSTGHGPPAPRRGHDPPAGGAG